MSQHENTPQFIKQVPWYASKQGLTSSIPQKQQKTELQQWYSRGAKGHQSSSYRKGACENCGGMGHSRKQCTERPRKICAKYTNKNIAADDVTKDINLTWEGKRDRWNGYVADQYKEVIEEHNQYQSIRKMNKIQQGEEDVDKEFKSSSDPVELANLPTKQAKNKKFQGLGGVRNREDYAKYLLNLDVNSDHFDPKSRSMRSYDDAAAVLNNLDVIGERDQLISQDRFAAQQVQLHNSELSSIALPTLTQKIYKKIKETNIDNSNSSKTKQILKKYGQTSNKQKGMDIIIEQNDQNLIVNKKAKETVRSRYEEDVLINDHTSVWGSWYNRLLGWGYACCHSTDKFSYCLGNKGKEKALAAELKAKAQRLREMQVLEEASKKIDQQENQQKVQQKK